MRLIIVSILLATICFNSNAQKMNQQKNEDMNTTDFTTNVIVDQTPHEVFNAVTNVRGWWSEQIEGNTSKLNDEFNYHYKDVHSCNMKVIEVIPDQKIVWLVEENHFKFTRDKNEWVGNKIVFDIVKKGNQTQLTFTQIGLVPQYECYDICHDAWTGFIQNSLKNLITTGKGQPSPKDQDSDFNEENLKKHNQANPENQNYHTRIIVNAKPHETFESINKVSQWWTENLEGESKKLNDEFTVRFGDVHVSTQKLIEVIPDKKVVWLVTDSRLNFVKNENEWTNTKIVYELVDLGDKTEIQFTQYGLVPASECFTICSNVWNEYLEGSLKKLIETGKGEPTAKE